MGGKIEPVYHVDRYDRYVNDLEYLERDVDILMEKVNELVDAVNSKLPASGATEESPTTPKENNEVDSG